MTRCFPFVMHSTLLVKMNSGFKRQFFAQRDAGAGVNPAVLLAIILLAGLAIRLYILPLRWINPDEGAHLLDARLLLAGQTPVADFGSRQPFYVLVIALFLKLFGVSHWAGRLMPLLSSLGVGWLLYLIGKQWRDSATGLIAAAMYVLTPLVVVWSTIVKTEQLTILLGVASMYFVLLGAKKNIRFLFLAGALAALAFYVRQPALYIPLAAGVFLLRRHSTRLKNILLYLAGFIFVCAAVVLFYLPQMSLQDILFSQLNPLNLIWNRTLHLFGLLPQHYRIVDDAGFRILDQSLSYTLASWLNALSLCLFIVFGALAAFFKRSGDNKNDSDVGILLQLWIGFGLLLYLYQTASRGFYTQYFTEVLPPLILFSAAYSKGMIEAAHRKWGVVAVAALGLFFGIVVLQKLFIMLRPGMAGYFVLSLGSAALAALWLKKEPVKSTLQIVWVVLLLVLAGGSSVVFKMMGLHDLYRFILVLALVYGALCGLEMAPHWSFEKYQFLLLSGFFFASFNSGLLLGPKYEAVWSTKTLDQVVTFLDEHGEKTDDLLSGGMIWTFESGLHPYRNVPHPTEFFKHRYAGFEESMAKSPPQFIILDGYTHRKFAKYWTFIKEYMEINYTRVARFEGSKYPVDIFQVTPSARQQSGFVAQGGEAP